tara:strand:+ start:402 stop:1595 length:1194 start_codon:yes stop_codon:yes gene_type:complete
MKFLRELPIGFLFLIAIFPHIDIGFSNIFLDDIPVLLFFVLALIQIVSFRLQGNRLSLSNNYLFYWVIYIVYTFINPLIINGDYLITTDVLRSLFIFVIFIYYLIFSSFGNLIFGLSKKLLFVLSAFSIFCYFFEFSLGKDAYEYWNIGFNRNQWGFTSGRINGFQAGGPNAFGDLIVLLGLRVIFDINLSRMQRSLCIVLAYLGCFFTYSRASLLVFVTLCVFLLIMNKEYIGLAFLVMSILFSMNFGLINRFSSESETEGISDRLEMQAATSSELANRDLKYQFFGYGFGNFAVVREEVKEVAEFSSDLRPTGPHNGFMYKILNYGYIGFALYLILIFYPVKSILLKTKNSFVYSLSLFGPIIAFLGLNLSGDLFQNESLVWLFWLYLFEIYKKE